MKIKIIYEALRLGDQMYSIKEDEHRALAKFLKHNGIKYYIADNDGDDAYVFDFNDISKIEPCYDDDEIIIEAKGNIVELAFVKKVEVVVRA